MSTDIVPPKPRPRLWGIYFADREYARVIGAPLRTVIKASTKIAAEDAAARLGFGDASAHPVTGEQAKLAQWLPEHSKSNHRLAAKCTRGIHTTS